ncbi:MAG: rRNA maturation RNase YbeY [Candidatus Hydrogenedentota bacterium]
MSVALRIRNESTRKRFYRSDALTRLIDQILIGENKRDDAEISILFCDDVFMTSLNKQYLNKNKTTDVLSFEQDALPGQSPQMLGDIVISLETVESNCHGEPQAMRDEVRMLVCHGTLHLLGYDHGTRDEKARMRAKQAHYLNTSTSKAWNFGPKGDAIVHG